MPNLVISLTQSQADRLADAIGRQFLFQPRQATAEEVKTYVVSHLRSVVQKIEREAQVQALIDTPFDPS